MEKFLVVFFIIPFLSCDHSIKHTKKPFKGFLAESFWLADSIPSGKTLFYDDSGKLYSKVYYQNGMRQGVGIFYNSNGNTLDSTFYINDLIHGYNYSFSNKGELSSKVYYNKGFSFGPRFFYENGELMSYHFFTFEQKEAYNCIYQKNGTIQTSGEPFFLNSYQTTLSEGDGVGIFAYMAYPPKIDCKYQLIEKDSIQNTELIIRSFNDNVVFIDTSILLKTGKEYYFHVIYKDIEENVIRDIMHHLNKF